MLLILNSTPNHTIICKNTTIWTTFPLTIYTISIRRQRKYFEKFVYVFKLVRCDISWKLIQLRIRCGSGWWDCVYTCLCIGQGDCIVVCLLTSILQICKISCITTLSLRCCQCYDLKNGHFVFTLRPNLSWSRHGLLNTLQ